MSDPIVITLDLPAAHRYLNVASACIEALVVRIEDVPDREMASYALQLAVQETCANIVDHAYAGTANGRIRIEFALHTAPRRFVVEIYDTGRMFDPVQAREPDLDNAQVRGYGLFLMNNLMDSVTYERLSEGNRWRLVKSL